MWVCGVLLGCAFSGCSRQTSEGEVGAHEADSTIAASQDGSDSSAVSSRGEGGRSDTRARGKDRADSDRKEEAVPVDVTVLELGDIESVIRSSANLEAENQVQVHSQAARLVRELAVEEGDVVKKGALLLRLQDDEQRSALARARASFAKADAEYERQKRLYDQTLTSERVLADIKLEYETQRIAVQDAERELSYTEVRAPISGTITSRLVKVGDQVNMGQHLFDIVDFDSIVARVYVPEKHIGDLSSGQDARIYASSTAQDQYPAKIDRIAPIVDARTGTVKITVAIGNQPGLLPGMYVEVDLVTDVHTDTVLLPKRALVYDNDQIFAYRLKAARRVERVPVVPRLADRDFVEPAAGFAQGDTIVVAGQAGLRDGALVSLPGDPKTVPGDEAQRLDD